MTDDHVCKWSITVHFDDDFKCLGCKNIMDIEEVKRRLNATEVLSAEVARECQHYTSHMGAYSVGHALALDRYADILEGKDER